MAIVKKYPAEIVDILHPIDDVYTLVLKSLGKPFKYESGQFLHLAIEEYDPTTQWPDSRCFSIQSSPNECNIKITFAAKGEFTRKMAQELNIGSQLTLKLPYGNLFSQQHNKENTVFIAGGTGITAFLSLFTHESFTEYVNPQIYLGFKSKAYNLYNAELENSNSNKFIQVYYENSEGILDIEKIFKNSSADSSFFISGPPMMISDFKQALITNGVEKSSIFTDDWE